MHAVINKDYSVTINFPGSTRPYTYALDADSYKKLTPDRRTLRFPKSATSSGIYYETVRIVGKREREQLPYYVSKQLTIRDDGTVEVSYYNHFIPLTPPEKRSSSILDLIKTFFGGKK